ncbi:MAG TPA: dihydrofolate reductase family protein [Solirubrobacteraceae bacterium]|nr:dihydrofolate reductase family protein [Solirubrobacteraceae bacterium]
MEFRQLLPESAVIELPGALEALQPQLHSGAERPSVLVNFVASADGRATFAGRSGGLGDEGDRAMFHGLRERADAILVGTRTLGVERYGRTLGKPERRERRAAAGRQPEPLACTVTRTGMVPLDIPLFAEPDAQVVIFTARDMDLNGVRAEVDVVRLDPGKLTLTTVLRHLRSHHGVELLLCEGGPMLFGSLLQEDLVDELFLTVAPKLTGGGTSPTITSGPELPELRDLQVVWALEREGSLYLRYALR